MVERIKAKLKLLEKLTDVIRQGLTMKEIRKIFFGRTQLKRMKEKNEQQENLDQD